MSVEFSFGIDVHLFVEVFEKLLLLNLRLIRLTGIIITQNITILSLYYLWFGLWTKTWWFLGITSLVIWWTKYNFLIFLELLHHFLSQQLVILILNLQTFVDMTLRFFVVESGPGIMVFSGSLWIIFLHTCDCLLSSFTLLLDKTKPSGSVFTEIKCFADLLVFWFWRFRCGLSLRFWIFACKITLFRNRRFIPEPKPPIPTKEVIAGHLFDFISLFLSDILLLIPFRIFLPNISPIRRRRLDAHFHQINFVLGGSLASPLVGQGELEAGAADHRFLVQLLLFLLLFVFVGLREVED